MKYFVALGNLETGMEFVGPFDSDLEAESFAHLFDYSDGQSYELKAPKEYMDKNYGPV